MSSGKQTFSFNIKGSKGDLTRVQGAVDELLHHIASLSCADMDVHIHVDDGLALKKPPYFDEAWDNNDIMQSYMNGRRYSDKVRLPALRLEEWGMDDGRREVLLGLYGEVCGGWKQLTDVRFKLLGLLPIVTLTVIINLLSPGRTGEGLKSEEKLGIAILGFLLTVCVWLYDRRNTSIYNDLIGRGREIETELGIHTGIFRGRPDPPNWFVQHDKPLFSIYVLSMLAWILTAARIAWSLL